jgi:hypothetical protein
MAAEAKMESQDSRDALAWSKMLADPSAHLVRAPSQTPFLASKARFVRSFDIPYSSTRDGNFAIAALPSSQVCAAISTAEDQLVSVAAPLSFASVTPGSTSVGQSCVANTFMRVINMPTDTEYGTMPFVDGSVVDASLAGYKGLQINVPAGATFNTDLTPTSQPQSALFYRVGYVATAGFAITWTSIKAINNGVSGDVVAAASSFVIIQLVSSASTPITNRQDLQLAVLMYCNTNLTTGVFATSAAFNLLKSEVLDAGKLGNHRCTAMAMLVTNMAPPLISGGELVAARCPFSVVNSGNPSEIMTTIKQLPEERYWRSGAIKDGSYCWWLPDDLQSYEPAPYPIASQPENILVAAGKMSDPGGFVRVLITYIFEFYTPVQLFSRDYNFTYSPMVQTLWNRLCLSPAVSPNAGHLALIAGAVTLANTVYAFYQQHKDLIDPAAKAGYKLAKKVVNQKIGEYKKEQQQKLKEQKKAQLTAPNAGRKAGKAPGTGAVSPKS